MELLFLPPRAEVSVSATANMVALSASVDGADMTPAADASGDETAADGTTAVGHGPGASVAADGAADPATGMAM